VTRVVTPSIAGALADLGSMVGMTTPAQPAPITLAPVSDEKNLLTVAESAASCCGGSACGIG
jgi:hypothetical protein